MPPSVPPEHPPEAIRRPPDRDVGLAVPVVIGRDRCVVVRKEASTPCLAERRTSELRRDFPDAASRTPYRDVGQAITVVIAGDGNVVVWGVSAAR